MYQSFKKIFLYSTLVILIMGFRGAKILKAQESAPFITVWQTDSSGVSMDNQIIIPGEGTNYTINWENVNTPSISGSETATDTDTVIFPQPGTYRVKISGDFKRINFGVYEDEGGGDEKKILEVEHWGDISWISMRRAFVGASNLQVTATDAPDLRQVTDLYGMFRGAEQLNADLSKWNTSNVTVMAYMFSGATSFNGDISTWDTSNLVSMSGMFEKARSFNQPIGSWNTGNVTEMDYTFRYASSFNQNIGGWNTENVTDLKAMFWNAKVFNQDISGWNTARAEDMTFMFWRTDAFNQDISGWNVSSVTKMGGMFKDASAFDQNLGAWDISNVTIMTGNSGRGIFDRSGLSAENYDQTLVGWANQQVQSNLTLGAEGVIYCEAASARQSLIDDYNWTINDAGWDYGCSDEAPFITIWRTDNAGFTEDNQIRMPLEGGYSIYWEQVNDTTENGKLTGTDGITITFPEAGTYRVEIYGNLKRINFGTYRNYANKGDADKLMDIEQWGDIKWTSMERAFLGVSNVRISAKDAPNLNNVAYLTSMFRGASSINANLDNWDVSEIYGMSYMFRDATNFNGNIGSWNTSNLIYARGMFQQADAFNQDIGSWDMSKVRDGVSMFSGADSFNQKIGGWNTGNMERMSEMFHEATSFNQDIGGWNTEKVEDMTRMFMGAQSFNQDINNWDITSVADKADYDNTMENMFSETSLSVANYDAILQSWANQEVNSNIVFGAKRVQYCNAGSARKLLIDDYNWTIEDAGMHRVCPNAETKQLSFQEGWNLLSIPFELPDSSLKDVFPDVVGDFVYSFNGNYVATDSVTLGKGYWVQFDKNGSQELSGNFISEVEVEVEKGWNLIAGPSDSVKAGGIIDQGWILSATPMYSFNGAYQVSATVVPGKSYWVKADTGGTITLDSEIDETVFEKQSTKQEPPTYNKKVEQLTDKLSKLTFKGGDDNYTQTLLFGEKLVDKERALFQLPPVPPSEAFDVRFADNYRVTSGDEKKHIRLSPGSQSEEITISYQPEKTTGSYQLLQLDGEGEVVESHTLEKEDAISLSVKKEVVQLVLASEQATSTTPKELPDEFSLRQNYPNPFNPATKISYSLPKASQVQLMVYNIVGRQIATLVSKKQDPGKYVVHFDASELSSGMYIYRLEAAGFTQTKQMMFVK